MNLEVSILTKMMLISILLVIVGGCKDHNYNNGTDIRPPLMNNNSFTNFVPMNMPTNNNVEVPL